VVECQPLPPGTPARVATDRPSESD